MTSSENADAGLEERNPSIDATFPSEKEEEEEEEEEEDGWIAGVVSEEDGVEG